MSVVPTSRTRSIAAQLLTEARQATGSDAVLRLPHIDPGQSLALLALILDAAAGNARRIETPGRTGRPPVRGLAIPCPTCEAPAWEPCRVPSGWASRPHAARRGKRCARCHKAIDIGRFDYCGTECREVVRKERDREYQRSRRVEKSGSPVETGEKYPHSKIRETSRETHVSAGHR